MDARIIVSFLMVLTIFHSVCVGVAGRNLQSTDSDSIKDTEAVEWIPTTPYKAKDYSDCAVVGGDEGSFKNPLWVIRAMFKGELLPGKLAVERGEAYVASVGKEYKVTQIEVLCARPESYSWVVTSDGLVPPDAIQGGYTTYREPLYIGRAIVMGSMTPGKVLPSHKLMFPAHGGKEMPQRVYAVLCTKS